MIIFDGFSVKQFIISEISTITGATGVSNIISGATTIAEDGSVTQATINLKGGRLINDHGTITADVTASEAYSASSDSFGGAIYNKGTISKISGTFKDNTTNHTLPMTFGGAIFNDTGATISTANADFTGNTAFSGGAIYNMGNYLGNGVIDKILGDFTGNKALGASEYGSGSGGAIANFGTINQLSGSFTNNTALIEAAWGSSGGAIYNEGILTIKSLSENPITFSNNQAFNEGGAIANSDYSTKPLTITADGSSIIFDGNSAKNGGALYNKSYLSYIDGTPEDGGVITLNATGADITFRGNTATGKGGAIYNNYGATVNMNSTGENKISFETSSDTIHNEGTININGNVVINSLITDNDTPTGILNLNGGALKLGSNAGVSNLNVINFANNPTLDLQNGSAQTLTAATINGNANLNIDIDFTGTSVVADAINIATGGQTGTVTVDSITSIGTVTDSFSVDILKGNTSDVTLAISDTLANQYKGDEVTDIIYEAEDYVANIDFDKTTFDTIEYTQKSQKTLSVNGTKLDLAVNITEAKHETGRTSEDALKTLNTNSGSRSMKATSDSSSNAYQLTADLGNTATGDITVEGRSSSDLGTLDMNGKGGFNVANAETTVNLKNLNITGAKSEDGSLINNSAGTVNLNNVEVAANTNDIISNNSVLNIENSTINSGIKGDGTTNVKGTSLIDKISQKVVEIFSGAKLETQTIATTNGVTNAGDLTVTGATNTSNITGEGSTKFTNDVNNSGEISQKTVEIASGKTLTTTKNITVNDTLTNGGTVTLNNAELNLNGSDMTIAGTIDGTGKTVVNGSVQNNGSIASAVEVATAGSLKTNADNVTGTISNGGNLELTGGDIKNTISGTGATTVSGAVTNTTDSTIGNAITIASTGDLTTAADKIGGVVTNNGIVQLDGGTLSQIINGGNIKVIDDVTTVAGNLGGATDVASSKALTVSGGDIKNNITGTGTTNIAGTVTNSTNISTATNITSGSLDNSNGQLANVTVTSGSLKSNADKVLAVTNNGTYEITGGTIANAISGTGAINITGNTINNVTNTTTGAVTVANGAELAIGTGDTFGTASSLTMANGSTLNIQNGSTTAAAVNNLVIASGETVNVKMDWGDTINSSSSEIAGSLIVSDINMATSTKSYDDTTYLFTNLGDKIALSTPVSLSNISDTTNNFVSYDNTTGKLTSYRNSLIRAVDKTGSGATATYVMTEDETAGGEELIGTLKVQGGGHTINTLGIKVGSATNTGADLTLEDVNMNVAGKALEVHGGNKVAVNATGHDITLQTTGTDEVISLSKGSASSIATAELGGSKTINITGDIKSDVVDNTLTIAAGTTVNHNGLLDPITVNVNGTENRTGGYDETVTYNVNNGGNLNFTNDSTLYDAGHHTAAMLNTIKFNGGTVNTINGVVTDFNLANLNLGVAGTNSYFKADVDLANQTMDKFTVTNAVTGAGKLNISQLNLISDATSTNTTINFTTDPVLMAAVNYTGAQGLTALSPIYRYNVGYDSSNGNFDFTRYATGGYGDFNPAIMAAPVAAQMGGYLTQLNSYDEAFYNMDMYMLMTKEQRQALKFKNKYASADGKYLYDSTLLRQERAEGWFRPFATFEKVGLKNGPKVGNVAYGTYMGGESEMYDLGHGWDGMWGAYVGYNGSHQTYDGVGIYQNGGTLGLVGMAYKGNFFTGLTLNAGASGVEASTMYGNEDFSMLMSGIASKTGYNWELFNGKFIVQPSMLMSYSFVNTFDYRNGAGVKIDSDPLHAIQLQPEIKFIGNLKNGWQPYASVAVVWNIMDDTKFKANDVALPELSVKPYVKYGVGVRKTWGERFTGFFQTYLTNGGRNGVGLQTGFTWVFGGGKDTKANKAKIQKSLKQTPELKKTEIVLNSKKVQ